MDTPPSSVISPVTATTTATKPDLKLLQKTSDSMTSEMKVGKSPVKLVPGGVVPPTPGTRTGHTPPAPAPGTAPPVTPAYTAANVPTGIIGLGPDDIVLDVECGLNKGILHLGKLASGSKGPCVLYDSAWLTPNEFQYVSGRETAKDWKRSIKHFGKSLKLLIAKGFLTLTPPRCRCETCEAVPGDEDKENEGTSPTPATDAASTTPPPPAVTTPAPRMETEQGAVSPTLQDGSPKKRKKTYDDAEGKTEGDSEGEGDPVMKKLRTLSQEDMQRPLAIDEEAMVVSAATSGELQHLPVHSTTQEEGKESRGTPAGTEPVEEGGAQPDSTEGAPPPAISADGSTISPHKEAHLTSIISELQCYKERLIRRIEDGSPTTELTPTKVSPVAKEIPTSPAKAREAVTAHPEEVTPQKCLPRPTPQRPEPRSPASSRKARDRQDSRKSFTPKSTAPESSPVTSSVTSSSMSSSTASMPPAYPMPMPLPYYMSPGYYYSPLLAQAPYAQAAAAAAASMAAAAPGYPQGFPGMPHMPMMPPYSATTAPYFPGALPTMPGLPHLGSPPASSSTTTDKPPSPAKKATPKKEDPESHDPRPTPTTVDPLDPRLHYLPSYPYLTPHAAYSPYASVTKATSSVAPSVLESMLSSSGLCMTSSDMTSYPTPYSSASLGALSGLSYSGLLRESPMDRAGGALDLTLKKGAELMPTKPRLAWDYPYISDGYVLDLRKASERP